MEKIRSLRRNSYPIQASYASGSLPDGVAPPVLPCPACQGLDFNDRERRQRSSGRRYRHGKCSGILCLLGAMGDCQHLDGKYQPDRRLQSNSPTAYDGPNYVYAISITPPGNASLVTYNSKLNPPSTYPVLPPPPVVSAACTAADAIQDPINRGQRRQPYCPRESIPTKRFTSFVTPRRIRRAIGKTATMLVRGSGAHWIFRTRCAAKSVPPRFISIDPSYRRSDRSERCLTLSYVGLR